MTTTEFTRTTHRPPLCTDPGTDLRTAAQLMVEADTSSILVGRPGELVSILTERDVTRAVARGEDVDAAVEPLAVPEPHTVDADATVFEAAHLMLDLGVRHLVLRRGSRAVGVISMRDVLGAVLQLAESEAVFPFDLTAVPAPPEHFWG